MYNHGIETTLGKALRKDVEREEQAPIHARKIAKRPSTLKKKMFRNTDGEGGGMWKIR
jgi:hypothetical protein